MPIYKPSELHEFLDGLGIGPKKGLSQNFLIDGNILRKIASSANLTSDDLVIEIGSGPGSLTEELLKNGAHVIAIEKDNVLASALERLKTDGRRLDIYNADVLTFPFEEILAPLLTGGRKAKVIANLPYHLTTPIIVQLVKLKHLFSSLILMVQDEVARRFVAKPKTSTYSSFTVFLNFYSNPHYSFTVSRNCFYPSPKVDSAIVSIELKEPLHVSNEEEFFVMTRSSFEQRRKMLRGSLREIYPPASIEAALSHIGCSPQARPEELSIEQFIQLFERLNKKT
ncbi:MAG: ribosomal RNA small subunit methyltransferase A [Parachlamydiaceae bacterium]|nr:ribosomal RNA small subunit methyltransferase A [Parachlamydiaceae bacterium]